MQFIWPPEVRWPPPANIVIAYDIVLPPSPAEPAPGVLHSADVRPIHGAMRVTVINQEKNAMTTGDKSAQSYGWGLDLAEAIPDGGAVKIPTPGFDTRYTDTRHADVSVGQNTYRAGDEDGKVTCAFDETEGAETVEVTNHTGAEWPAGAHVYVFCPHLLAAGANEWDLKEQVWDLQQRVLALEGHATAESTEEVAAAKEKVKAKAQKARANHKLKGK